MQRKKAGSTKAEEVQLTVRLTPEGFEEAERRLADLKQRARIQALDELLRMGKEISARGNYTSEEEALADIQAAVDEVRAERRARQGR